MRPINQNVLVKADEVEEKTAGGLYLPDENKQRKQHAAEIGTLVARCDDAFEEMKPESQPKPGDKVFFAKYAGAAVDGFDGEAYRLMKDVDITGVAL
jgi:chaperonin GroES